MKLLMPVNDAWDSQGYHSSHRALDFGWLTKYSKNGKTKVIAAHDGKVIQCGRIREVVNGKVVHPIICVIRFNEDGYTWYLRYWHLNSVCVKKNQKVSRGQKIGIRGNTGYSGGVHLHFEVLRMYSKGYYKATGKNWDKFNINPVKYLYRTSKQHFKTTGKFNIKKE